MSEILLQASALEKTFEQGGEKLTIFKDLNMQIASGEIIALVGPSGAGKSTLLQLIGLLDTPSAGTIAIKDKTATGLGDRERTILRRDSIGFIYQFHNLLPEFSALENVLIPQMIAGKDRKGSKERAVKLLSALGMGHRLTHRPARLSGGEQQRVAIARAIANGPHILLADEPTGNLDPVTSEHVFSMLIELVRSTGIGAVIATHNMTLAARMDRILEMKNGQLVQH